MIESLETTASGADDMTVVSYDGFSGCVDLRAPHFQIRTSCNARTSPVALSLRRLLANCGIATQLASHDGPCSAVGHRNWSKVLVSAPALDERFLQSDEEAFTLAGLGAQTGTRFEFLDRINIVILANNQLTLFRSLTSSQAIY